MSNRIVIRRTPTPGNIPTLAMLLAGEMALNIADDDLYVSTGSKVIHLNSAAAIKTDATHRFLTDVQIAELYAPASSSVLGNVKIGENINVNEGGVISLDLAGAEKTGLLSTADWNIFKNKQDALGYTPVDKTGDTMLGDLVLNGAPTSDNMAANKLYVDNLGTSMVSKAGDTMSGLLVLSADPLQNLGAATKQYVDGAINTVSGRYGSPVQALIDLTSISAGEREDKQMRLVEDTGAIFRFDAQSIEAADGSGVLLPLDEPSTGRWIKVQAATQNHENLFGLLGGAVNDHLHLTTTEKNGYDAHLADTSAHLSAEQALWIAGINASSAEVNYSIGVTGPIQSQLDGKQADLGYTPVNRAGDVMQGLLTLFADPTLAMHAVTLQYLESYVVDGGVF